MSAPPSPNQSHPHSPYPLPHHNQPPGAMAAMASGGEDSTNRRSASIANLILPPSTDQAPPPSSLLSLSHLAASMQPATHSDALSNRISRTRSVPPGALHRDHFPDALPPDARAHRQSRASGSTNLGVAHGSSKRLSRTKSGFSLKQSLRAAAAVAAGSARDSNTRPCSPAVNPHQQHQVASPATPQRHPPRGPGSASPMPDMNMSPIPSPSVLRPISSNPAGGYASKHTSASNSGDSCALPDGGKRTSPGLRVAGNARKELFQHAAQRFSVDYTANALARMRSHGRMQPASEAMMDVDGDYEQREPSSSSHDAKLISRPSRARTTPDAKRAQNRESAKRFRVAQKKRWAELQETVERKDMEISRLKNMLQEVTNQNLASRRPSTKRSPTPVPTQQPDAVIMTELEMFVKLMCLPTSPDDESGRRAKDSIPLPIAANIGIFFRVLVVKVDGYVLGIRHQKNNTCSAMGGDVGTRLWEHVHSSDVAHLRFTVVHAGKMASVMNGEPNVFSYRRRERVTKEEEGKQEHNGENEVVKYIRMKGCLCPMEPDENEEVTQVLLAEFIEI